MDLSAWSNVCDPGQHDRDFANAADYTDLVIRVVLNTDGSSSRLQGAFTYVT